VKYWLGPKLLALEGSPKKGPGYYKGDMNGKHLAQKRTIPKITLKNGSVLGQQCTHDDVFFH
jgi:hypothetical protein